MECRIRVCGERVHHSGVVYGWQAEPDVLWRTLAAAARWCLEGADGGTVVLQVGAMAEVVLRDGADVEAYLRDAIMSVGEIGLIELTAIESERFRTVAVEPGNRRVSLIEGGLLLGGDGWRATVVGLTAVLEQLAELAVYAFVKRGSSRWNAKAGDSLAADWPPSLLSCAVHRRGGL